jgi:predicted DNA-binding transcriptional regulator AlpA
MANKRKDNLREEIRKLKKENKNITLKEIAKAVGLKDRQWVYYYLKKD